MKFEEIANHILSCSNRFEEEHGIETIKVECIIHKDDENWAIFYGYKSDNTKTLFFARKNKYAENDKWIWFCPSESEVDGLKLLIDMYEIRNARNEKERLSYR